MEKRFLSVAEFLAVVNASRSWYEKAWRRGDVHRVVIGGRTFIPIEEPDRLAALASHNVVEGGAE